MKPQLASCLLRILLLGRVIIFLVLFLLIYSMISREFIFRSNLAAKTSFPSYARAGKVASKLWKKKYLLHIRKLLPNPEGRGILCGIWKRKRVCYYRFHAVLHRPFRSSQLLPNDSPNDVPKKASKEAHQENIDAMKIILQKGRKVKFWLQFVPQGKGLQGQWMLAPQRFDFLSGSGLRWRKI